MKLIEAVISSVHLEDVKSALLKIGIDNIMVKSLVRNGGARGKAVVRVGAGYVSGWMTKIRVEIVAADEMVAKVIDTIGEIAKEECSGMCRIYIHSMSGTTA